MKLEDAGLQGLHGRRGGLDYGGFLDQFMREPDPWEARVREGVSPRSKRWRFRKNSGAEKE